MVTDVRSTLASFETIISWWGNQQNRQFYLNYNLQHTNPFHQFLRQVDLYEYDINEQEGSMGLYLLGRQLTDLNENITSMHTAKFKVDTLTDKTKSSRASYAGT